MISARQVRQTSCAFTSGHERDILFEENVDLYETVKNKKQRRKRPKNFYAIDLDDPDQKVAFISPIKGQRLLDEKAMQEGSDIAEKEEKAKAQNEAAPAKQNSRD
ncbi:MAG: hypothetical protein Q9165_008056 [Trypethelium subeluteriae]